jgi:hypothetical protein
MKLSISKGNSKVGRVANISLPPVVTCGKNVPCAKDCYAMKSFRMYPNVRDAWQRNLDGFASDPATYFATISKWVAKNKPSLFRWHVAGDIVSHEYLMGMNEVALSNPGVKFLAFTKRADLLFGFVPPSNMSIVVSQWPGWECGDEHLGFPRAWMQDGTETRVPENAVECFGNCETCGMCWALEDIGRDVVFMKH